MQQIGTRNIALLIIGVSLIATVLIFKTDGDPRQILGTNETKLITDAVQKNRDTDTDADGVPDWQELINGTNPKNPNTFNIEGGDAAYIESRKQNEGVDTSITEFTNTDNLTEQIARGTLGEYLLLKSGEHQTGYGSPEELAAAISGQSFNIANPTLYSKTNLTIVNTNRSTLLAYADALRRIDNKYPDSAIAGLGSAINVSLAGGENDPQAGTKLSTNLAPYVSLYENATKDILAIPVPDTFVNEHLNLVNSSEGVRFSLVQLTKLDTDPARALLGAQLFLEYSNAIEQTYGAITKKLALENIPL